MSELKENIIRLLVFIAAVVICSFVISLFQKKPKEDKYFQMVLALKDSINEGLKRERDAERRHSDEKIKLLMDKDSVYVVQYKTNTIKYEKIPVTVSNYSDDELRRAAENFR